MHELLRVILIGFTATVIAMKIASFFRPCRVEPAYRGIGAHIHAEAPLPIPATIECGSLASIASTLVSETSSLSGNAHTGAFRPSENARYTTTLPDSASRGEQMCAKVCRELFGDDLVYYQYRDPIFANCDTGRALEFDIFYPNIRFAVEFEGRQHYENVAYFGGRQASQAARDHNKRVMAQRQGITLVSIPYTFSEEQCRNRLSAAKS